MSAEMKIWKNAQQIIENFVLFEKFCINFVPCVHHAYKR